MKHILYHAILVVFALLVGVASARVVARVDSSGTLVLLGLAAFPALAAADLLSGLAHWLCDTYFQEDTPLLGPLLIQPFREHHRDPLAITRRDFAEVNASSCAVLLPVLAVLVWEGGAGTGAILGEGFLVFLACAICLTNTFHQWAHAPDPPAVAGWLQRSRLAISRRQHALHHRTGDRAYCITTGWLNPLLDRTRFFRALEGVVAALTWRRPSGRRPGDSPAG